ncbi:PREDICTED: farnesol dehydrogenase-like [Nicrophorus vespilloides]|uniref:Farnesol dehydrogenase-like n=1 Tax=Nicrophorus vespilloides TaxID=110193 RepID=A0ABM1MS62_NICVS|nr:PREDICTED: farnesol dehydrogenase-like [Nicrophorus vespilloides]
MVLSMDRWVGKVAVVTGASTGIGAEVAKSLCQQGMKVVGLARRIHLIKPISSTNGSLLGLKVDITQEDEVVEAFEWILKNVGPVSVLVNNAGLSQPTTLIDGDAKMWKSVLDTNVLGLSIATREAISHMKDHNIDGHVIHINSVLGHYVAFVPNVNMYTASKHAVTALTETLRQELLHSGTNIRISSVSPGPVDTELLLINKETCDSDFLKTFPKLRCDDVSDAVIYVLSTPPHVQVQDVLIRPLGEPV